MDEAPGIPLLRRDGLRLRPPRGDDGAALFRLHGEADVRHACGPAPASVGALRARLVHHLAAAQRGTEAFWCIVPDGADEPAGFIAAGGLRQPRAAALSYALLPEHRGRGWFSAALRAVRDHLFGERGVVELRAAVHPGDRASAAGLRSCGFGLEARLRRYAGWHGEWAGDDALRFSCWTPDRAAWRLRAHDVTLGTPRLVLRPMGEDDWPVLLRWSNDPEVLYYAEGDDVDGWSLPQVQSIYRGVSRAAFCFVMEHDGAPVGECWLQDMNLERIWRRHGGQDCRRIDLAIGEPSLWGRGLGTEAIGALARFAFEDQGVERLFGVDVADYNPRSRRAFEKNGFVVVDEIPQPAGGKARWVCDLRLDRGAWSAAAAALTPGGG